MIRYFRINDPYRLLGLFVLLLLLYLPHFIDQPDTTMPELKSYIVGEKVSEGFSLYSEVIDNTPPLAAWFYGATNWIFGRSQLAGHITGFLILFFQSVFIGILFINKKAFTENTFIPSFLFSVLAFISFDTISLTADLAAFGFLLLVLNNLFKEIEFREQRDETIFNIGLFIAFASLLNFSCFIYLPGTILILIIFTRNSVRKYVLLVIGFLLPHMLLSTVFFLQDRHEDLLERYYLSNLTFDFATLVDWKSLVVLCSLPLFYLLISIFILNRSARLTKYQSQLLQVIFLWFVVSWIQVCFTPDLRPQSLLPLVPSVSFFFTHFFLLIRRKKFAEMNGWILVIGVAATAYLTRYEKINQIDTKNLYAPASSVAFSGKRVLNLSDVPGVYVNNTIAPAFINWDLSEKTFRHPDEYRSVLLVNRLFQADPPEIILDPDNLMVKFFDRIPSLKSRYKETETGHWIIESPPVDNDASRAGQQ